MSKQNKMGLSEASRGYLDQLLVATPTYGWGWSRVMPSEPALNFGQMSGPAPFRMRVLGFFDFQGELRGAKAKIEEPGHSCDGWFVGFSTRHAGEFDFETRVPVCNISIGPVLEEADWPKICGPGAIVGFAEVRRA